MPTPMVAGCFFHEAHSRNMYSGRRVDLSIWHDTIKAWAAPVGQAGMLWVDMTARRLQPPGDQDMVVQQSYLDMTDIYPDYPAASYVFIEAASVNLGANRGTPIALEDYTHPTTDRVIYVVGPDSTGLTRQMIGSKAGDHVYLSPPGSQSMWAEQALSVVLYHRAMQLGS